MQMYGKRRISAVNDRILEIAINTCTDDAARCKLYNICGIIVDFCIRKQLSAHRLRIQPLVSGVSAFATSAHAPCVGIAFQSSPAIIDNHHRQNLRLARGF